MTHHAKKPVEEETPSQDTKSLVQSVILGSKTGIELGLVITLGVVIGALWNHILPTETRVEAHEARISAIEKKIDTILSDTGYIRGKIEVVEAGKRK